MADGVIKRNGYYEVDPSKMKKVRKSVMSMSDEDVKKVVDMRNEYMRWVHDNFAKKVIKPPENTG